MSVFGHLVLFFWAILVIAFISCSKPEGQTVVEIKCYPLDNLEGVITQAGVEIDKGVSSDGNGSLRITATGPTVVRLFETGDIDV